jgi:hypothetical protein
VNDSERDVLALWQDQTAEGFRMTPEEIQRRAQALETRMRVATRNGYKVFAFLIVGFSLWAIFDSDPITRAGAVAIVLSVVYIGCQAYRSRFRKAPAPAVPAASIDHLRMELARQRDFHRGKRFWSRLLFIAPAGSLFFYGFATAHPELIRIIRFEIACFIVLVLAAIPLNLRMASKYQRQIDELDRQKEQP